MSWPQIAEVCGTYANKIRRDAKKLGLESRSTSEAQSIALATGRQEHPTEGKGHNEESRLKISERMSESWENLTPEQLEHRRQIGRDYWDSLSEAEKQRRIAAGADAIRLAARQGSKLEKFLYDTLTKAGFILEFHRERVVTNQKLQIDIFLPELNTAIEVDGPSHFLPIWGEETLQRNKRADNQKSGLILAQGWCLIRVRQDKPLSQKYKRDISKEIISQLESIKKKFPTKGKRLIIIGGEQYDA